MAVSKRWPQPEQRYRGQFGYLLGDVQLVKVSDNIAVANMVAQHGVRNRYNPVPLNYDALSKCLENLSVSAITMQASVHIPRIGCGLANGSWAAVQAIIKDKLTYIETYVYDLE